mmetsp:Transcript_54527/g.127441  ORF Transcript_54527/g.127441 Transcript_54527/m.127441 type:complete len:146 (+) Transcript_54527:72-509(+)
MAGETTPKTLAYRPPSRGVSFGEADVSSVSPRQPENEEVQFERALAELDLKPASQDQDEEECESARQLEQSVFKKLVQKEARPTQRADRWSVSARKQQEQGEKLRPLPSISKSALWARRYSSDRSPRAPSTTECSESVDAVNPVH